MDVFLSNNSSPPNVVKKSLSKEEKFTNVIFRESGSLSDTEPEIVINLGSRDVSDVSEFNYARIPKFGSYYYIESKYCENNRVRMKLKRDPISTFAKDIYNSKQYVLRNANKYDNPYLIDLELPIKNKANFHWQPFGQDVYDKTCTSIILETAGRGAVT